MLLQSPHEDAGRSGCFLSVVVPAYNERGRILSTLERFVEYLNTKNYTYEILVVDDYSTDDTLDVAGGFARTRPILVMRNRYGKGKGGAVKTGMLHSKGDYALFSDADASTPIEEVDKLFAEIEKGYDIVIGSRALRESAILKHQPFYREWMGKTFNILVQGLLLPGIHDTQCGFKLFTRKAAGDLFSEQRTCGFSFDVEILYLARKRRYKIKEIPVRWVHSEESRVRLLTDAARMFVELLKIRLTRRR